MNTFTESVVEEAALAGSRGSAGRSPWS